MYTMSEHPDTGGGGGDEYKPNMNEHSDREGGGGRECARHTVSQAPPMLGQRAQHRLIPAPHVGRPLAERDDFQLLLCGAAERESGRRLGRV